jgi:hypothetical protein
MPFVLFLLGAAAVGLIAASASAGDKGKSGGGGGRTYTLDKNLPPALRQQVLAALATEKNPASLLAFAADCANQGYPLAATALTQRAVELGGAQPLPPGPQPQPSPQPSPQPTPGLNPVDPGLLPEPPRSQVLSALQFGTDPNALEALAVQVNQQGYTYAAQALRLKEAALRAMPPQPQPAPTPVQPQPLPLPVPTPVQPQPAPQPAPVNPFSLDPGMPPAMQAAVLGALTTEQDPVKLQAFAQSIQNLYPIAAGLLMAKANALRLQPGPGPAPTPVGPTPVVPPGPGPSPQPSPIPPPGVLPTPGALPIGDDSTRTGRNAGRPSGYPFIHLRGESTYPAKIAGQATGNQGNYPQMSAINPQFAADGVHWKNIQTGDALNIPWAWVPKLASLYRIEVDPGVQSPSLPVLATSTALARKGGPNGLATHA